MIDLDQITNDLKSYHVLEQKRELESQQEAEENNRILEEIQKQQEGRDDKVDALLAFANKQLDMMEQLDAELKVGIKKIEEE